MSDTPKLDDPDYGVDSAFNACSFRHQCSQLLRDNARLRAELEAALEALRVALGESHSMTMQEVRALARKEEHGD